MKDLLRMEKTEVYIMSGTVLLRLVVFLLLLWISFSSSFPFPVIGTDSGGYVSTARNLLAGGGFTTEGASEPQSYIMPLYPIFLATMLFLFRSIYTPVIIQIILAGISAVFVYRIGSRLSHRVGIGAALLFALDPVGVFYSNIILTEALFIFSLLLTTSIFMNARLSQKIRYGFSSILLGVTTLVRPSAIVLPAAFILLIFLERIFSIRDRFRYAVLFVVGFVLIVFPWSLRNKILFDTWELTAVAVTQWYQSSAPLYYAYQHGITHEKAMEIFRERLLEINPYKSDLGTLRNAPYMRRVVIEYLSQDPLGYLGYHLYKSIPFFISDGLRDIARRLGYVEKIQPNIGDIVLARNWTQLKHALFQNGLSSFLLIAGSSVWIIINTAMVVGFIAFFKSDERRRMILLFCFAVLFCTILIAGGPSANARYRLSVSPFMFIPAVYGADILLARAKQWAA